MYNFWRQYKYRITSNCLEGHTPSEGHYYWRNKLFAFTLIHIIPIFILLFIPSYMVAFELGILAIIYTNLVALFALLFLAFKRNLHVYYRKILFFFAGYLLITALLFTKGPVGPSLLFMLTISIFAVLFMNRSAGFATLFINISLCALYELGVRLEFIKSLSSIEIPGYSWILLSANFAAVNLLMVILLPTLLDGLQETINKQKSLEKELQNKQGSLLKSVDLLRKKGEALELVNERYNTIAQLVREAIWNWNMSSDSREWSTHKGHFFGYNLQKELSTLKSWSDKIHPDQSEKVVESFLSSINSDSQTFWEKEYLFKTKSGEYVNISDRALINRSSDGSPIQMLGVMQDITSFKKTEETIREALAEKETLLAEIHHRVKNNLAVVSGLLELQSLQTDNGELSRQLLDSTIRIKSMASIHEQLYQSKSFSQINLGNSLEQLIKTIVQTYQSSFEIELQFSNEDVLLNMNKTVPCSLIINEVITNILKHAFKDSEKGFIKTEVQEREGNVEIVITDNGAPLPDDFGDESKKNMGLFLIETLTAQIEGEHSYSSNKKGTSFTLKFDNRAILD
ncbi:MAG: PAS domain-containing protein [Balneolaceae bacterium]|nr:PAS domain-containing protein [Balneolaceae bacterium]